MADPDPRFANCSDSEVAAKAGDAQMRLRAWQVYGPAVEEPEELEMAAIDEWKRRVEETRARRKSGGTGD